MFEPFNVCDPLNSRLNIETTIIYLIGPFYVELGSVELKRVNRSNTGPR